MGIKPGTIATMSWSKFPEPMMDKPFSVAPMMEKQWKKKPGKGGRGYIEGWRDIDGVGFWIEGFGGIEYTGEFV